MGISSKSPERASDAPCPYCGSRDNRYDGFFAQNYIECRRCGAQGSSLSDDDCEEMGWTDDEIRRELKEMWENRNNQHQESDSQHGKDTD